MSTGGLNVVASCDIRIDTTWEVTREMVAAGVYCLNNFETIAAPTTFSKRDNACIHAPRQLL
jgi:hypothetical protein